MKSMTAVVTGASSGIGEAFARELASQGIHLILVARRKDRLEKLRQELLKSNSSLEIKIIALDLTESGALEKLYDECTRERVVNILINNAGVGPYRHFLKTPLSQHFATINLNLLAVTELCHRFATHMLQHGQESYISNIASVAAFQGVPRFAVYAASKSYLLTFSTVLNRELRGSNLSVSCVCPGGTATEFLEKSGQAVKLNLKRELILMSPAQVAKTALKGTFARKPIIIPGLLNKIACFLPRLLPDGLSMSIAAFAMSSAVEETQVEWKDETKSF